MFPFTRFKFTARCSAVFIVAAGEFLSGLDSKPAVVSEGCSVQALRQKERISVLPRVRMRSCCCFVLPLAVPRLGKVRVLSQLKETAPKGEAAKKTLQKAPPAFLPVLVPAPRLPAVLGARCAARVPRAHWRGAGTPGTGPFSASGVQRRQCPKWKRFKQPTGRLSSSRWGLEEKGLWLSSDSPSSRGPERSPAPGSKRWGNLSPSPAWCSDPCRNCSARGMMNNCTKKKHGRVTHKPPRTPKNKRGSVGAALGSQCPVRRQRMGRKSPWGPGWGLRGGTGAGRRLWDRASQSQTRSVWGCQAEADTGLFWDWLFPLSGLWHGAPWRQSAT